MLHEGSALPSNSALCNTYPKPHCRVLPRSCFFKKKQFHITNILCSVSVHKNWPPKAFQPSQMPSRLYESYFRSDSQLPEMSSLKGAGQAQWPCAISLFLHYKSLKLLCHAPSHKKLDEKHQAFDQRVSGRSTVLFTAADPLEGALISCARKDRRTGSHGCT